jgi:hypothetical protein
MTRDRSYAIVFATALVLFAVIYGLAHMPWCDLPIARAAATGDQATTCAEFWINRYQSAIAAIVTVLATLVAAVFTARFVWRQTLENRRQSDAAAFQIYRDLQVAIAERIVLCENLVELVKQLAREFERFSANPNQGSAATIMSAVIPNLDKARNKFVAAVLRAPRGADRDASDDFAAACALLAQSANAYIHHVLHVGPRDAATEQGVLQAGANALARGERALVNLSTLMAATLDRLGDLQAKMLD